MLNISVIEIDTGGHEQPVQEGELGAESKLVTEAKATKQLDRIAPDWPLHLHDGAVIDHILKVINNPRISYTEITRRYRAPRAAADLVFRGVPLRTSVRR